MKRVIRGGRVIDPSQGIDRVADIQIEDGKITQIGTIQEHTEWDLDAQGMLVVPGLVDIHVHLREPGFSHKETLETGTRAAINGGFTTVACMPNTQPAIHNSDVVRWIQTESQTRGFCSVEIIGAITKDIAGTELAEIESMVKAGIVGISDDGKTTMDKDKMREAMTLGAQLGIPLISHAEEHTLSAGGAMHLGERSKLLGIPGIPSEAEWKIVERDILLSQETGCPLHIAHISTREGIELVRQAKKSGLKVTCEAGPHHFILNEDQVYPGRTETKVNPPLRSEQDRLSLLAAIFDGTVDAIATDHAPHDPASKAVAYEKAAFGISGIETSFALSYTELVLRQGLPLETLIRLMTINPSRILNLNSGTLKEGTSANIAIIDPEASYTIQPDQFYSMGKNSPFRDWQVQGLIRDVLKDGKIMKLKGEIQC